LYEFKLHEAQRKLHEISEVFGEETVNEHIVQLWFKKFHGGDLSLEDEEGWGHLTVVDSDQMRALAS
jgi:hypothetical protein